MSKKLFIELEAKSLLAQILLEFTNSETYQKADEDLRRKYSEVMLAVFCA